MTEELLAKIIVIVFVVALLITDHDIYDWKIFD